METLGGLELRAATQSDCHIRSEAHPEPGPAVPCNMCCRSDVAGLLRFVAKLGLGPLTKAYKTEGPRSKLAVPGYGDYFNYFNLR